MKTTLLTIITLICFNTFGQNSAHDKLLKNVESEIKTLKKNNVDSIIYFFPYYIGPNYSFHFVGETEEQIRIQDCKKSKIIYLIYQQDGKTKIRKYNECWRFKTLELDSIDVVKQFANNFDSIIINEPKDFQSVSPTNDTLTSYINHCGVWDIYADIRKKKYHNTFKLFCLAEKSYGDKDININYLYNKNLTLIKLFSKLERQLRNIKFEIE